MSGLAKFLNLTRRVINTNHIVYINKNPDEYNLILSGLKKEGFMFYATGWVISFREEITVTKHDDPEDYSKVTNWISKTNE